MTRYAMVVDLRRCVGCQTCTAACKHTNATDSDEQLGTLVPYVD